MVFMRWLSAAAVALALFAAPGPASAQDYIFPESSMRALGGGDLAGLECLQLWLARNEIFNRNGHCFRTALGQEYFSNADCWTSNAQLSRLEWANVNLIKDRERRMGCRVNR